MCTTMIITKGATQDGSMMVTHSDDDDLGDQRIIFVPAQDHAPNTMRDVIQGENVVYPRIVSKKRGPGYDTPGFRETRVIGQIPQVPHTFAYFDGNYGIMNEHNLMIGECTNNAKYMPTHVTKEQAIAQGKRERLFYSSELSRIALERCSKAHEAVKLMGHLIDTYGYFSTGETLLVADEDEAWVFEMCALPHETYHSAWVAQKVPDGQVFVAANEFRIREIIVDSPKHFLYSSHLIPGLEAVKWVDPDERPIDWLRAVSTGEYYHPYYALRRVWRVLDRVNPDLGLSPWVEDAYTTAYPFAVTPKARLETRDVFALYRDHYEGTQFDLSKGVAAGPYGNPSRYVGPYDCHAFDLTGQKLRGAWERPISVFYQGYTYVAQTRPSAPDLMKGILWFGPDVAYTTCFTPFPTKVSNLPHSYQIGSTKKLDRNVAWWAFYFVANWAKLNYQRMTRVDILPLQEKLEDMQFDRVQEWTEQFKRPSAVALKKLTEQCNANAAEIQQQWWDLADTLVAKYSDGYINLPGQDAVEIGYPSDWLGNTNYSQGPVDYDIKL